MTNIYSICLENKTFRIESHLRFFESLRLKKKLTDICPIILSCGFNQRYRYSQDMPILFYKRRVFLSEQYTYECIWHHLDFPETPKAPRVLSRG